MQPLILKYRSGEEIKKGDRVVFHGNPAEIELVSTDPNDPEQVWHVSEFGGGVLVSDPMVSGRTFIPRGQLDEYEDLEYVSRAELPLPTYKADEILNALQGGNYKFVLENAMPQALAGNADAQCTIALMYESGLGVERNVVEAERWLVLAAKQNSALAWNNLGSLYATKYPDLESRWDHAQECWQRAAELGFDCAHPYPPRIGPGKRVTGKVPNSTEDDGNLRRKSFRMRIQHSLCIT